MLETSPELTATAGAFRTTRLLSTTHNCSSGQLRQDGCLSEKGSRRPRPTIGKLKPSLRKRRIEMILRRMPMELDLLDSSFVEAKMQSEM